MLVTWLINHLMCGIYVGLPKGQILYVITLDQHVIHRQIRVIKSQLSKSLEPTTYHSPPGGSHMGFTVHVDEKSRESYRKLNTGQLLGKTVIQCPERDLNPCPPDH